MRQNLKRRSSAIDEGERAVERLLTIVRTCQLQQLNALTCLTAAIAAHRRRQQSRHCSDGLKPLNYYLFDASIRSLPFHLPVISLAFGSHVNTSTLPESNQRIVTE